MTELIIDFPGEIRVTELDIKTRLEIPEIPAEKITGVLHPEQIPLGVIPDLEGVVQIQDELTGLTARVLTLEEAETVTPQTFSSHVESYGNGGHIPLFGITNNHIADGAAIAPSKLNIPALYAALELGSLVSVGEVVTPGMLTAHASTVGKGAHIPSAGISNAEIADDAAIAPSKLDLQALEQALNIGSGNSSSGPPTIAELTYTVSQSSLERGVASLEGTYAQLTDGSHTTGAGTNPGTTQNPAWVQFDLGSVKFINEIRLSGGNLADGFGATAAYLNGLPLQVSRDGTDWNFLVTIQGTTNDLLLVGFAAGVWARYVRIFTTGTYIGIAEMRILGA